MTNAFGAFTPNGRAKRIIGLCRKTPLGRGQSRKRFLKQIVSLADECYDIDVRGANMRLYPKTNSVESKLLLRPDAYCSEELAFIAKAIAGGTKWFVDAGANIGAFSLPIAVNTDAKVLAFEPNPPSLARLKFNVAANPAIEIRVEQRALSDKAGTATFHSVDDDLKLSGLNPDRYGGNAVTVETMTLQTALSEHGVAGRWGLKIDVEGHEDAVLNPYFDKAPETEWPDYIIIEAIKREGLPSVIDRLRELGYLEAFWNRANLALTKPGISF